MKILVCQGGIIKREYSQQRYVLGISFWVKDGLLLFIDFVFCFVVQLEIWEKLFFEKLISSWIRKRERKIGRRIWFNVRSQYIVFQVWVLSGFGSWDRDRYQVQSWIGRSCLGIKICFSYSFFLGLGFSIIYRILEFLMFRLEYGMFTM